MKDIICKKIESEKLVVIVRGIEKDKLIPLSEAMYEGGIRFLELTFGKDTDIENARNINMLAEHFEGRMDIGAGTVLTEEQVSLTKDAGGKFIISPNISAKVIEKTVSLDMVSMPGAFTPSEIQLAHETGADFVKVFPITSLGPEYVKAVLAPLSHIKLLAVGGINENNMADYLKAGAKGFGIGSNIIDKKKLAEGDFAGITTLARSYVSAVK